MKDSALAQGRKRKNQREDADLEGHSNLGIPFAVREVCSSGGTFLAPYSPEAPIPLLQRDPKLDLQAAQLLRCHACQDLGSCIGERLAIILAGCLLVSPRASSSLSLPFPSLPSSLPCLAFPLSSLGNMPYLLPTMKVPKSVPIYPLGLLPKQNF